MIASVPPYVKKKLMEELKENNKDTGKTEKLRKELNLMIDNGVRITVEEQTIRRGRWPWSKRLVSTEQHVYEMKQPTLGCLDLINYYSRDMKVDEDALKGAENPYPLLRRLCHRHTGDVSRAMAVAILGRRVFVKTMFGYRTDYKAIDRLAETLKINVTPGKLFEMAQALSVISNMSDFLNSIRLMLLAPDRIEATEGE